MDQHKDLPNWKKRKAEVERAVKMLAQKRERTLYLYEVEKQSRRRTKEQQLRTLLEYETKEMQRAQAGLQAINNRITVLEKDQQRYSSLRMIGLIFIFAFLFTFAGLIVHHYGNDQVVVEESRSESWITDIFTFLKRYSAGNNALTGAVVGIPDGNCHEEVHCVNEAPPAKEEILPAEVEEPIEEIPPDAAETTERKSPTIGIQEITIQNAPSITLVLNTTNLIRNDTDTNLTAYNTTQTNGNSLKVIYNWLRNGTSIAVLNMPFEGINGTTTNNAYDYSGNRNNGS
ncbi:MAG: hypothetical protein Q8R47_05405, partial [Nanoarchaeota archaeon]|nr:hypothetical protein [Nanoarchaeota archaeon]